MAVRTIVYNFIREQAAVIEELVERQVIEVLEWFSYPPHGTVNITEFADVRYNLDDSYGRGEDIYEQVYETYSTFLDMHQRRFPHFQNTLYDSQTAFNMQFGVVVKLLATQSPDLVLFGNIPHGGHDLLLYEVAKALGIRTLVLFQIPICARFFILENIEDLGRPNNHESGSGEPIENPPEVSTPVYMRRRRATLKSMLLKIRRRIRFYGSLSAMAQRAREARYSRYLRRATRPLPDDRRLIYFPLHLQPEMTTSAMGGVYGDQVLAIERLARKIPPDVLIGVKENPKQSAFQRPQSFFQRLNAIPNAMLVSSSLDTYELIRRAVAVATVTGTAGWEAINLGKPVIVFGHAWYEALPGVIKYDQGFTFDKVLNVRIDRKSVVDGYRRLLRYSSPGVVQSAYFGLQPDVGIEKNNELVASGVARVISQIQDRDVQPIT